VHTEDGEDMRIFVGGKVKTLEKQELDE